MVHGFYQTDHLDTHIRMRIEANCSYVMYVVKVSVNVAALKDILSSSHPCITDRGPLNVQCVLNVFLKSVISMLDGVQNWKVFLKN